MFAEDERGARLDQTGGVLGRRRPLRPDAVTGGPDVVLDELEPTVTEAVAAEVVTPLPVEGVAGGQTLVGVVSQTLKAVPVRVAPARHVDACRRPQTQAVHVVVRTVGVAVVLPPDDLTTVVVPPTVVEAGPRREVLQVRVVLLQLLGVVAALQDAAAGLGSVPTGRLPIRPERFVGPRLRRKTPNHPVTLFLP